MKKIFTLFAMVFLSLSAFASPPAVMAEGNSPGTYDAVVTAQVKADGAVNVVAEESTGNKRADNRLVSVTKHTIDTEKAVARYPYGKTYTLGMGVTTVTFGTCLAHMNNRDRLVERF